MVLSGCKLLTERLFNVLMRGIKVFDTKHVVVRKVTAQLQLISHRYALTAHTKVISKGFLIR